MSSLDKARLGVGPIGLRGILGVVICALYVFPFFALYYQALFLSF